MSIIRLLIRLLAVVACAPRRLISSHNPVHPENPENPSSRQALYPPHPFNPTNPSSDKIRSGRAPPTSPSRARHTRRRHVL